MRQRHDVITGCCIYEHFYFLLADMDIAFFCCGGKSRQMPVEFHWTLRLEDHFVYWRMYASLHRMSWHIEVWVNNLRLQTQFSNVFARNKLYLEFILTGLINNKLISKHQTGDMALYEPTMTQFYDQTLRNSYNKSEFNKQTSTIFKNMSYFLIAYCPISTHWLISNDGDAFIGLHIHNTLISFFNRTNAIFQYNMNFVQSWIGTIILSSWVTIPLA